MLSAAQTQSTDKLHQHLQAVIGNFPGEVGVAFSIDNQLSIGINGQKAFPLFSVVKFHQALAVVERLREEQSPLTATISVAATELEKYTWSPLRDKFPRGGEFGIGNLLEYTLTQSDNNVCDILFHHVANTSYTQDYIRSIGISGCGIVTDEATMHRNPDKCRDNHTTPQAAVALLDYFHANRERDEYARFVWNAMSACATGENRIPKYLRNQVSAIVHKTGTGGTTKDGKIMGVNDMACIKLPQGHHCSLAIFVANAGCDMTRCEQLVATIAKASVDFTIGLFA